MFKFLISISLLVTSLCCSAQIVTIVKFDSVQNIINRTDDTTYVINFWATWCKPCVHELPDFVKLDSAMQHKKVKLILVSMDVAKEAKTRVVPFLTERKMGQTVWLLDDPDYNAWIDKVDPSWSGAIPATLILEPKNKIHIFRESELKFSELLDLIKPIIKN